MKLEYEFYVKVSVKEFRKRALELEMRKGVIEYIYADGRIEQKDWKISKLKESSDLMNNVRTRSKIERGEWKEKGIIKVVYKITEE